MEKGGWQGFGGDGEGGFVFMRTEFQFGKMTKFCAGWW